ncbi:ThuA domain-containing protein [Mucilaginibacter sp. Bleaf8]|uniref:ThuA domain-containing protein n=1 Tax=Mucilaginibacter sp. Bleaf8 TaxID=2834430 RepID=UPI001BCC2DCA|nr:ThuA domain-containing protein [Mucilaginibacter sp. Bleaf8]MBS7562960.1 ThuA domain-containing protein [Mucilaginibacter sp. Bleaf8]
MKRKFQLFIYFLTLTVPLISCVNKTVASVTRILVFSKTAGFHHASIPAGIAGIQRLGKQYNFEVDTTTNSELFTSSNLERYNAVIFLNTTGDVLNATQQVAFEQYIKSGKGFVGIHAASDTEYDWAWYGKLVGAYFKSHPEPQQAMLNVVDQSFIATRKLPAKWSKFDEWYNFKSIAPDLHILITIDEKSYTGGENGSQHPVAWYHAYGGGRAFYTALGHTDESYNDPLFLQLILGGIQYAADAKQQ